MSYEIELSRIRIYLPKPALKSDTGEDFETQNSDSELVNSVEVNETQFFDEFPEKRTKTVKVKPIKVSEKNKLKEKKPKNE